MGQQEADPEASERSLHSRFGSLDVEGVVRDMPLDRAYGSVFDAAEAGRIAALQGPAEVWGPRQRLVRANEPLHSSLYLTRGFIGRTRLDRSGRRQFLALQIPGDYVDLPAFVLHRLDHDLHTMSEVAIRRTDHADLSALGSRDPVLMQKLWRISLMDAAIHRYWIFRIGRLAGRARIANFFCELFVRLYARGLGTFDSFALPLTQTDIAEACGMTPVHANRLIGELRAAGTCDFSNGEVLVNDPVEMFRVGNFSWDYLYLPPEVESDLRKLLGSRPGRA